MNDRNVCSDFSADAGDVTSMRYYISGATTTQQSERQTEAQSAHPDIITDALCGCRRCRRRMEAVMHEYMPDALWWLAGIASSNNSSSSRQRNVVHSCVRACIYFTCLPLPPQKHSGGRHPCHGLVLLLLHNRIECMHTRDDDSTGIDNRNSSSSSSSALQSNITPHEWNESPRPPPQLQKPPKCSYERVCFVVRSSRVRCDACVCIFVQ